MNVLIACEFSGVVRNAFTEQGHNAISCDLLDSEIKGPHIKGNVEHLLKFKWDLIIAHPPCTYLCNSGVRHLKNNPLRKMLMREAVNFFNLFLNARCDRVCVENPIPHKYGIGKTYTQIIQPYEFGHPERKATCLWLKGLPKLKETKNVKEEMLKLPKSKSQRLHYMSPGPDRGKERSRTFEGIAEAMAIQWTNNATKSY